MNHPPAKPDTPFVAVAPRPGQAVVLYDGDCRFCQRSVAILRKLDWLHQLAYHSARDVAGIPPHTAPLDPAKLLDEMHLLTPDRHRTFAGYAAFCWIAWRLPLLLPLAPLLHLPGVVEFGHRLYRWVARNRFDLAPCHEGACSVPRKRP